MVGCCFICFCRVCSSGSDGYSVCMWCGNM